ncbi:MAG: ferritin-like domain-containing protein [Myxococcales bacterium]|jgi:hypothetical protein
MAHSRTPLARTSDWSGLVRLADPEQPQERRALGQRVFQRHFAIELEASSKLVGLPGDLREVGGETQAYVAEASAVARDVGAHLAMLDRALRALGGAPQVPEAPTDESLSGWPARARITRTVVQTLCIDGSLRERELLASVRRARDPLATEVLRRLAEDSRRHVRLGWSWLGREGRRFPEGLRDWVIDWLPEVLARAEMNARPRLEELTRTEQLGSGPFGELAATEREVIFLRTMHEQILPRLRRAGFDATSAWSLRPAA